MVRFIIRRDDPPLFLGRFTAGDIVIGFLSVLPPFPMFFITRWPLIVCIAISVIPCALYVLYFRMGRPPAFFHHWLRFQMRPKMWRCSVSYADTLLGARNAWLLCARPLPNRRGKRQIWQGVGFPRILEAEVKGQTVVRR